MDVRGAIDQGRSVDWGKVSADYARYRPGPPPSFYARLAAFGVGLPAQHDALLRRIAPDTFTVRHRLDARFFDVE
jgi:hypothetical protein